MRLNVRIWLFIGLSSSIANWQFPRRNGWCWNSHETWVWKTANRCVVIHVRIEGYPGFTPPPFLRTAPKTLASFGTVKLCMWRPFCLLFTFKMAVNFSRVSWQKTYPAPLTFRPSTCALLPEIGNRYFDEAQESELIHQNVFFP